MVASWLFRADALHVELSDGTLCDDENAMVLYAMVLYAMMKMQWYSMR